MQTWSILPAEDQTAECSRMRRRGDLRETEHGMVIGARWGGLNISETAELLGFSCISLSMVYTEWSEKENNIQ